MSIVYILCISFAISGFVSFLWVNGIDRALRDYPEYKGEDLFNENTPEKEN